MPERKLRLLSLDGGGVRGLASLLVLRRMLAEVGNPKPYQFFDMICGTSTGGIIAIMLGILHMTIKDCIKTYSQMMSKVFVRQNKSWLSLTGKVKARYSTASLEKAIEEVIANHNMSGGRMRNEYDPECKVIVTAMDMITSKTIYFTNYERKRGEDELFSTITILDAALATTAATSFFADKKITNNGITRAFGDAALGENNPVSTLWAEARRQYDDNLEGKVRCLLSLGTGVPQISKFGDDVMSVAKSVIDIAKETEFTARRFRESNGLAKSGVYYRFSPPDIYSIRMDDAKMSAEIEALTADYLEDQGDIISKFRHDNLGVSRINVEPQHEIESESGRTFQTLSDDVDYIVHNTTYWRHLTLEGYQKYEKIYMECRPVRNAVGYVSVLDQFKKHDGNGYDPSERTIEDAWARLLRKGAYPSVQQSNHPKGLVMAALYMLHVESSARTKTERPFLENGQIGVVPRRREVLKRFAKWVPCQCSGRCGKEWNFVNDAGLGRGGNDSRCRLNKLVGGSLARVVMASTSRVKQFEDTKKIWYEASL